VDVRLALTSTGCKADVKKAFELYTDNVTKLAEKESNFSQHADEMAARGNEYFKEWKKAGCIDLKIYCQRSKWSDYPQVDRLIYLICVWETTTWL